MGQPTINMCLPEGNRKAAISQSKMIRKEVKLNGFFP